MFPARARMVRAAESGLTSYSVPFDNSVSSREAPHFWHLSSKPLLIPGNHSPPASPASQPSAAA